jgi:hypothetical protein
MKGDGMKRSHYFLLCNLTVFLVSALSAVTEWTALVFVQANNNLSPFAMKNFSDMASIGSNETLTTLVQWYQPNQQGTWRYKVEKGKMVLEECNPSVSDGNTATDLIDAMKWAVTKFPAKKYSLILWDHGIGILDPAWGRKRTEETKDSLFIDQSMVQTSPRIQIDGITLDRTMTFTKPIVSTMSSQNQRGILFNEQSRTYMNNQSLSSALSTIKTSVLGGKKIDLLGMDACLMAMVEIGYLAHQSAQVMVASQEVELAHGWNYASLVNLLSTKGISPTEVAQGIVASYQAYYKDKIQFYTQSAINLEYIKQLKESIDSVISAYRACQKVERSVMTDVAQKARKASLQFSAASYIDLYTFYTEFNNQLHGITNQGLLRSRALSDLQQALTVSMNLVQKTVIASTAGRNLARAKGLSIYFPQGKIDDSYPRTTFAQEGLWYGFIKELCA